MTKDIINMEERTKEIIDRRTETIVKAIRIRNEIMTIYGQIAQMISLRSER